MKSSYQENNYGEIFTSIVTTYCPAVLVELGVLHGYSTMYIAKGIEQNRNGKLDAFDLFEDYPYNHSQFSEVKSLLEEYGYDKFVALHKQDAFKVAHLFAENSVGFLHVDLSNAGDTVKKIMEQWDSKIVQGGIVLFEGGSEERDKVEWMIKYQRPSLKLELETNLIIKDKYIFGTYLLFPSLTVLLKKRY